MPFLLLFFSLLWLPPSVHGPTQVSAHGPGDRLRVFPPDTCNWPVPALKPSSLPHGSQASSGAKTGRATGTRQTQKVSTNPGPGPAAAVFSFSLVCADPTWTRICVRRHAGGYVACARLGPHCFCLAGPVRCSPRLGTRPAAQLVSRPKAGKVPDRGPFSLNRSLRWACSTWHVRDLAIGDDDRTVRRRA